MAEGVKYHALLLQGYGSWSRSSALVSLSLLISLLSHPLCNSLVSFALLICHHYYACSSFSSLSVSNVSSSSFNLPFVHSPLPSFTSLSLIHIISIVVYSFVVFPPSQSSLYHPLVSFVSFCSISLKSYPLPFPIILVYSRFLFVQIAFPVFPAFVLQLEFVIFGL